MKRIISFSILVGICFGLTAAPKKDKRLTSSGYCYLETCFDQVDRTQKAIHDYAELGYKEYRSSELLASILEKEGFTVERGVAGIPTAFIASYGSGRPVIGLLGEYDALAGLSQDTCGFIKPVKEGEPGHGCGHNLIGAASCYAAIAVSKWLSEGHEGTVVFYGCPAEEGGGGKNYMSRAGCFDRCDAVLHWHPGKRNEVPMNTGLCNLNVVFTFKGLTAHAGGKPWLGRSALDAVEAMDYMTNLMREHMKPDCRMHYTIKDGGGAPNVVPATASVDYYFRSPDVNEMMDIFQRAVNAARGAALGTGTGMSYEILNGNYAVLVNRRLCEVVLSNFKKVGGVVLDEREKALCREVLKNSPDAEDKEDISNFEYIYPELGPHKSSGGSSDIGCVSQVVPTNNLRVAATVNAGGGHCWQMTSIGGTTVGTKACIVCAKVLYLSTMDLMSDKTLMKEVRDEFEAVHGKDYKYVPLSGDRQPPLDYNEKK